MRQLLLCTTAAGALVLAGCTQPDNTADGDTATMEDVQEEVSEAVDAAGDLAASRREAYIARIEDELDAMNKKIDALRLKAREQGEEMIEDAEDQLADLEAKRKAAATKLEEVQAQTSSAWTELREGMDAAMGDLRKAVSEASGEFDGP